MRIGRFYGRAGGYFSSYRRRPVSRAIADSGLSVENGYRTVRGARFDRGGGPPRKTDQGMARTVPFYLMARFAFVCQRQSWFAKRCSLSSARSPQVQAWPERISRKPRWPGARAAPDLSRRRTAALGADRPGGSRSTKSWLRSFGPPVTCWCAQETDESADAQMTSACGCLLIRAKPKPAVVRYAVLREPRQGAAALREKQATAGSCVAVEFGKGGVERRMVALMIVHPRSCKAAARVDVAV